VKPTQSNLNNSQYWLTAFLLIPVICSMQFGSAYTADKGMSVLYSGLAGGVAGAIGIACYYFTEKRKPIFRLAALMMLAVVAALPTFFLPHPDALMSKDGVKYSTCPVCGYVAYRSQEKSCDNCGIELTEDEMRQAGIATLDSLINLEQSFYFIPDDEKMAINFNQPTISEDGYMLDKSWSPTISKAAIEKQATYHYEFRKKYPVKVQVIKKQ
jgi:hypothetical protein